MSSQKETTTNRPHREQPDSELPAPSRRLWSPWRLKYVAQDTVEGGCIFCNRLASADDTESLILRRTNHTFVIMNLFPYNTGHVMIVPNRHVADPEELTPDEQLALSSLLPDVLSALRRVLSPAGFNVGINIGSFAGAGIADHLHQHVVPRWQGDANFMPIIAGAMVMPELIPATYAKVRAELERPRSRGESSQATLVVLDRGAEKLVVTHERRLPIIEIASDEAIHRAAASHLRSLGITADLAGWAGPASTREQGHPAFAYLAPGPTEENSAVRWVPITSAQDSLAKAQDRAALRRALTLDLTIASAPPNAEGARS